MKEKILVTGGCGYIGSHAVYLLLKLGYDVVIVDNLLTGFKQSFEILQREFSKSRVRFYNINLLNEKLGSVFDQEKNIKAVMHFAGSPNVSESMENPNKHFENNFAASLNLLKYMEANNIKILIFSSTCAVYGDAKYLPVDENHPTTPENPYGQSKLMTEEMIKWNSKLKDLKYIIFRYFNVSGVSSDGLVGDSQIPSIRLVQNAVRGALGLDNFYMTCEKVDTPDGTPIRDIINVEDLCEAHVLGLEYLIRGGENSLINLGTGEGNSVADIVEIVGKEIGTNIIINSPKHKRKGEYARMVASNTKAKEVLGWFPKKTMKDNIVSLIKWYESHPNGWEY